MAFGEYFNGFSQLGRGLIDELDRAEQKSALSKLGDQLQTGDYSGAAGTAFKAGDLQTGINLLKLGQGQLQATQANERFNGLAGLYGGGGGGAGGGFGVGGPVGGLSAAPQAPAGPTFASSGGALGDYLASTRARESAGNDAARNPNSTATGRYQFTSDTWAGLAKKYPDLGLTPGGRTDPAQQERAMQRFTADNADYLSSKGLPITPGNLYGAHFLGAGGAASFIPRAINNPDAPAAAFAPSAAASNRNVFYNRDGSPKTAGEVYSWFGGQGGGVRTAAPQRVASADPSFAPSAPSPLSRPLQLNPSLQAPQQATDGGGDVDAFLTRSGLPVNAATRGAIGLLGPEAGRRFISNTLANPQAPTVSNLDDGVAQAHPELFLNADGSPRSSSQAFGLIGRQQVQGGFGRPAPSGLNPGRPVAVANNEADTQRLEQQMGMVPAGSAPNPQADMPVANAQPAEFRIPPGPQQASVGSIASLPAGLSSPQPRGPLAPQATPSLPAPTLPDTGAPPARVMTLPGEGGDALPPQARAQISAQAPQHLAQAGLPPAAAQAGAVGAPGSSQRIGALMRIAALPGLSDAQAGVVKSLLTNELEQTRLPELQKNYMLARSQGFGGTLLDYQNELRKPLTPTIVSPGNAAIAPGERTPFYVNPRAPVAVSAGTTLYDTATNQPVFTAPAREGTDEGAKIAAQIEARRQAAPSLGLQENTPAYRSFVGTGKLGADRDMSAGDKKAIDTADNAVLSAQASIGMLEQAKELSAKAYAGPLASERGKAMSLVPGNEAGQATLELDNLVTTNALTNLKSIFGGNPTEGERKILLDVAGSSNLPHALRVKIYQRAIDAANLRLQQNQEKAAQIREGTYYRPGSGPGQVQGISGSGQGSAPALPPPSPSNRPGAVSPADRFGQLVGSGLSKAQAFERLQQEGY